MLTLNDGRTELWQWDTGRNLAVDADCSQVHFSNKVFGRSIDVDVVDGVAIIPDVLLQTDNDLNVWAFVGTAENGYTKISKTFKINRRNKPADYVFTPTDQTTLAELSGRLDRIEESQDPDAIKNAVENYLAQNPVEIPVQSVNGQTGAVELTADDVGAIADETDPTVPEWAKQPAKPTYTAAEVGALPDTYIPPNQTAEQVGADPKGAAASAVSQHNTDTGAHNDLRIALQGLSDRINAALDSDDTTLDQMSEVVAYIKSNKSMIDAITTSKVSVADIVDNLTTNISNKPLSAAQGVALKELIDTLSNNMTAYRTSAAQDVIDSGLSDRVSAIEEKEAGWNSKYSKPTDGIPKADLANNVQASLVKADTALQEHQSLAAYRTAEAQNIIDNGKQDKITSTNKLAYSLISGTPTIPTVPTNVSAFTNDEGYLTLATLPKYEGVVE